MTFGQGTPTPDKSNSLPLIVGAVVAVVAVLVLGGLVALGKASWADVGPTIALLAGVHGGAALTAYNPTR